MNAPQTNYDAKRAKLIKMVHIAARSLGLINPKRHETDPEDEYHLLLRQWNRPGTRQTVTSSTQMSTRQLEELYRHLKRQGFKPVSRKGAEETAPHDWKKYPSSLAGLKQEICDLAHVRWGEAWEPTLNNFCRRFGIERWQWLDVSHGKAVKGALLRLQEQNHSTAEKDEE